MEKSGRTWDLQNDFERDSVRERRLELQNRGSRAFCRPADAFAKNCSICGGRLLRFAAGPLEEAFSSPRILDRRHLGERQSSGTIAEDGCQQLRLPLGSYASVRGANSEHHGVPRVVVPPRPSDRKDANPRQPCRAHAIENSVH